MNTEIRIPGPFATIGEIKAANRDRGHYWFSPDTMRFFRSRILGGPIKGRFFIASRQCVFSDGTAAPREYVVHAARDDGSIETLMLNEIGHYQTAGAARTALRAYIRQVTA